jgi:hypothetical protein
MRPALYEAARALTTAGFSADIYFNPSEITNRLKKSIQRQITNCAITGGYSSQAARIARHLMDEYGVPYSRTHWSGLHLHFVAEESQRKAVEIVQADIAAYLLDNASYNASYEKKSAADNIRSIQAGVKVYVRLHSRVYADQLLALMTESMTPVIKEKAAALAARLEDPTPIKITMKDWS